jgi:hypothetical protein
MARRRRSASIIDLALVAPQVIALRSLRSHDTREMQRMGTEKVFAFWESMNAMGFQMVKAQQEYALLAMRQWAAGAKVLEEGLRPIHRRAAANARRLRRR